MKKRYNDFEDLMNVAIETGDSWLDKKLNSHICYGGKGGGGSAPQDVPKTLQPYVTEVLDRASDLYGAQRPYQAYPGERIVGFSQPEIAAQQGIAQQVIQRGIGATAPGLTSAGAYYNPAYGLLGQATGAQQMGGAMLGRVAPSIGQAQRTLGGVQPALGMYGQAVGQAQQALGATAPTLGQFEQQLQQAAGTYGQAAQAAQAATGPVDIGQLETQKFMDPYQQQVTDIAKREAVKEAQLYQQQLAAQAAQTGGFGGSRQALLEGQAMSDLGGRLADIQSRGSQAAYQQALQTAAQQQQLGYGERSAQLQRQAGLSQALAGLGGSQAALGIQGYGGLAGAGRETAGQMAQLGGQYGQIGSQLGQLAEQQAGIGGQYGNLAAQYGQQATGLGGLSQAYGGLGQQALGQQYRELGYLSGVGEAQRGLEQQRADTAYQEFLQQRDFPSQQLQQYSSLIQGFPFQITQPGAAPSALQQGLGTAVTLGGLGRGLGFYKEGGKIDSGLSGVANNMGYKKGGTVYRSPGGPTVTALDYSRGFVADLYRKYENETDPKKKKELLKELQEKTSQQAEQTSTIRSLIDPDVMSPFRRAQLNLQTTGQDTPLTAAGKGIIRGGLTVADTPFSIYKTAVGATRAAKDYLTTPYDSLSTQAPEGFTGETPLPLQPKAVEPETKPETKKETKAEVKQIDKLQKLLDESFKFDREAKEKAIKSQQGFDIAALGMQLMSKPMSEISPQLISQLGVSQKELAGLSEAEAKNKLQKELTRLTIKETEADIAKKESEATAGVYLEPFEPGELKKFLDDMGAGQVLTTPEYVDLMTQREEDISNMITSMGIKNEAQAKRLRNEELLKYARQLLEPKKPEDDKRKVAGKVF